MIVVALFVSPAVASSVINAARRRR